MPPKPVSTKTLEQRTGDSPREQRIAEQNSGYHAAARDYELPIAMLSRLLLHDHNVVRALGHEAPHREDIYANAPGDP